MRNITDVQYAVQYCIAVIQFWPLWRQLKKISKVAKKTCDTVQNDVIIIKLMLKLQNYVANDDNINKIKLRVA